MVDESAAEHQLLNQEFQSFTRPSATSRQRNLSQNSGKSIPSMLYAQHPGRDSVGTLDRKLKPAIEAPSIHVTSMQKKTTVVYMHLWSFCRTRCPRWYSRRKWRSKYVYFLLPAMNINSASWNTLDENGFSCDHEQFLKYSAKEIHGITERRFRLVHIKEICSMKLIGMPERQVYVMVMSKWLGRIFLWAGNN